MTRAKTIRVATSVGLGLAVLGDFACRSADKIEEIEPASVQPVTDLDPPAGVEPIRLETVEPSGVGPGQIVIEDDVRKLCEVRDNQKPILINGDEKWLPEIMIEIEMFDDNLFWGRFAKPGARFSPDIIHDRFWEDERHRFLLAPLPGE